MKSLFLAPLMAFVLAAPMAQAKCEAFLSARTAYHKLTHNPYYVRTSRLFAILSILTMPVADSVSLTPAPIDPPAQIETVDSVDATEVRGYILKFESRFQRAPKRMESMTAAERTAYREQLKYNQGDCQILVDGYLHAFPQETATYTKACEIPP